MTKRLCTCGHVTRTGYCDKCKPRVPKGEDANQPRRFPDGSRVYDWQWDCLSREYRKEHPLCEDCLALGKSIAATSVHHVIGVMEAPGKRLNWDNLRALCEPCHKIADERRREGIA